MKINGVGKPAGCKLIRVEAEIESSQEGGIGATPTAEAEVAPAPGLVIRSIRIRGDFFAIPEEGFERVEEGLTGVRLGELAARLDSLLAAGGVQVYGISGSGVAEVLEGALYA